MRVNGQTPACLYSCEKQPQEKKKKKKKDKTLLFKDFCSLVFLTVQYKHSGAVTGLWGGKEREDGVDNTGLGRAGEGMEWWVGGGV